MTTLPHISTLSCHPQRACIHYNLYVDATVVHDSSINIQIVYTVTTQIDFVRIATIMILPHFISNWTILMF